MKSVLRWIFASGLLVLQSGHAVAQTAAPGPAPSPSVTPTALPDDADTTWSIPNRSRINEGTVTVITEPAGGAMSAFGSDLARVLDNDTVRVLPVQGKGPVQNVVDVLFLKSIDMGLVTADVPEFYKLQYKMPDVASNVRYIAKLYNSEIHIVAPTWIKSISDLEGKRIVASTDLGYYSAKVIFSRLGIKATFDHRTDDAAAIQKIINGEADAYITNAGKVFQLAREIKNETRLLHLVAIPYDQRLQDLYLPTTLSSDDYPNLLGPCESVDTIATSVMLVSFNWPENSERYNRVAKFVTAFFSKIGEFQKPPRHPKWDEASISVNVPGWQRFKAAQDWLDHNPSGGSASAQSSSEEFKQFVSRRTDRAELSHDQLTRLFSDFLEWKRSRR
jgi:TRAP-type uncharacterized transport system substrate-binding protein